MAIKDHENSPRLGSPSRRTASPEKKTGKLPGKSTFGSQTYSHRVSAPIYSFSRAPSTAATKMFIDNDHAAHEFSWIQSAPPGSYDVRLPTAAAERTNQRWAASSTTRQTFTNKQFNYKDTNCPGPGAHDALSSLARASLYRSSPATNFAAVASKQSYSKVFLSSEHARHELLGTFSPGPASMDPAKLSQSMGRQADSKRFSSPGFTQSRGSRFFRFRGTDPSLIPGPGSYEY